MDEIQRSKHCPQDIPQNQHAAAQDYNGNRQGSDMMVICTDAALHQGANRAGLGIVASNRLGKLRKIWAIPQCYCREPEM